GAFETRAAEAILAIDRAATGVDRSKLLRRLASEPDVRTIVSPGLGYGIYRPGRLHGHIGPLVASNDVVPRIILDQIGRPAGGEEMLIDTMRSAENTALMEAIGLSVQRRLTRMTLAPARPLLMGPQVRAAESFTWG